MSITFQQVLFLLFSTVTVLSAVRVITVRNPVHAVLFLVLTFVSTAAIWLLAEAEFLGIVLVLVYVGAVMVLFLFVVMMLDVNLVQMREGFIKHLPVGILVAVVMVIEMGLVLTSKAFDMEAPSPAGLDVNNTEALGEVLYTQHVYAFEIAAVILLVAIVAAISLTLRRRPNTLYQKPGEQVKVHRDDRLKIVKMPAEKKSEGDAS